MTITNPNKRLAITVDEVAELLGIARGTAYESVNNGEIPSVRIGRRILVPRKALEEFLQNDNQPTSNPIP